MPNYNRTKFACYYTYVTMAATNSLPPLLFVTFHRMYSISYTLLGSLLLVNFFTQLCIDLIFTFFGNHFNIKKTVRVMPIITSVGFAMYALIPLFAPEKAFTGLVIGTVLFSVASGLCEVLLSPLIAAIPSDTPEKDMSILHSLYGWGVVLVVIISTIYFKIFGTENWMYLSLFIAATPIVSSVLYFISPLPEMSLAPASDKKTTVNRHKGIFLCAVCIILGSSSENIMTSWISSFMEKALLIPKATGDILGMAVFALFLAFTRSLYAKFGKNIKFTLLIGMCGAAVCYLVAGLSSSVVAGFLACILAGIFTSMLWPGTLIMMENEMPSPGVAAYALMAACGDFGAATAPQLTGIIVDKVSVSRLAATLGEKYSAAPDQIGLKVGMLCAAVFPILGALWMVYVIKSFKKKKKEE
ncbi:MAG: MFS transporter [Clostridia bacterium]|nr:MFS transporter [Clostridia bacterium]